MATFWGSEKHQRVDFIITSAEIILTVVIVFQIGCELREGSNQVQDLSKLKELD